MTGTESSQFVNQILGLATQLDEVKSSLDQVAKHATLIASHTQHAESVALRTNLTMEGIAKKTDENHHNIDQIEASIRDLRDTKIDTNALAEDVHQLISDSFTRLQRYLEQKYYSVQSLDIGKERLDAQQALATKLVTQIDQMLAHTTQSSGNLAKQTTQIEQATAKLASWQEMALGIVAELGKDSSMAQRVIFPIIEKRKRHSLLAELSLLITLTPQGANDSNLADHLASYTSQVSKLLEDLQQIRSELLSLWHSQSVASANSAPDMHFGHASATSTALTAYADTMFQDEPSDDLFPSEQSDLFSSNDESADDLFSVSESILFAEPAEDVEDYWGDNETDAETTSAPKQDAYNYVDNGKLH